MTRARSLLLFVPAALALLPLQGTGRAGCRPIAVHHGRQQLVVDYAPVIQPQTYYVGQQLQLNAQEDRLAQKTAKLVLEQLRAQALQAPAEAGVTQPETLPLTAGDELSLVRQFCSGCHSTNEKAVAHLDLSDLSNLDCDTRLAMVAAVADGSMPKGKKLDGQARADLIGQLSYARTAPNAGVKPQPAPVVEQLEVAPEPPKPEPEKPAANLPKWKFKEGECVIVNLSTQKRKVVERHRIQRLDTGEVTNLYTIAGSDMEHFVASEQQLSAYSEGQPLPLTAATPKPNQESEVIE